MQEQMNKTLRFGGAQHKLVLEALNARKKLSVDARRDRVGAWEESEKTAKSYIKLSEADKLRDTKRDNGKQDYVSLEIPYSYALLMASHTYWTTTFLGRNPVLQYSARHGAGAGGSTEQAVEALMNYQANVGRMLVPWTFWLFDTPKYGEGWIGHYWLNETKRVAQIVEEDIAFAGFAVSGKTRKVKKTVDIPGYQGNKTYNIRPQDAMPDPRVAVSRFQQGEFFARYVEISWLDLHEGGLDKKYINLAVLEKMGEKSFDPDRDLGHTEWELPNSDSINLNDLKIPKTGVAKCYEMYVKIIPKHWKLGKGDRKEIWVFLVADNMVVIQARPLGEYHGEFPIDNMEYEIDAHTLHKRSLLEITSPLNKTLTWLINSHFYGVRKALNNQFVYDPSRVRSSSITDPEQGLLIRMRPEAYGQPIGNFIQQLKTTDVTRSNINDSTVIMDMMQRVVGVNDIVMGMLQQGGRQTATEVRGASGFAMSRLKNQAEFMSAMGFAPHGQRLLQATQQHLDVDRIYKIAGDLLPGGPQEVKVSPESIAGFYDFEAIDGTLPVDRFAQANLFKELIVQGATIPQIAGNYDIGMMFAYTAQLAGAKNINRFKINIRPDEQIIRDLAGGNIIPIGGNNGAPNGGSPQRRIGSESAAGGAVGATNRTLEPSQIPSVGPVS